MANALNLLHDGPDNARRVFIFAHGAGAAMDSPFMEIMTKGLAAKRIRVIRFEFPYMERRRTHGTKSPPDREPKLRERFLEVFEIARSLLPRKRKWFIGGKSMGGRMASLIAGEADVDGLVCFGYPFHPIGKPEKLRTEHLQSFSTPTLIVQGERDGFGNQSEVPNYSLDRRIQVSWLPDGDHGFKPRKASGSSLEENLNLAIQETVRFVRSLGR